MFEFYVEAALPSKRVNFTLSCQGSDNMSTSTDTSGGEGGAENAGGGISDMSALVMPYQKVRLGSLKQVDPYQGWGLSTSMSWTVSDDPDVLKFENEDALIKIEDETKLQIQCEAKHDADPSADPIPTIVERTLADGGGHFLDLEFAPCAASIASPGQEDDTCKHVTWRRATDFLEDTPAVFEDAEDDGRHSSEAIEASDIRQVSGWGVQYTAATSVGFLFLPIASDCSWCLLPRCRRWTHTQRHTLPPSPAVSRCLPMSTTTRLSSPPNPHPSGIARRLLVHVRAGVRRRVPRPRAQPVCDG